MADAVIANWDGHDYQARYFWIHATGLRDPDQPYVVEVSYEADGPKGFDDVVVRYSPGRSTRRSFAVEVAHHQVKFHVSQEGRFGYEDLTKPTSSTRPLAQIQWTAAKNRACGGHYVNIVRSMKWMKQEGTEEFPKYPKGYPLEHMIGHVIDDGTSSMAAGLVQVLESIRDTWEYAVQIGEVPMLPDHGVPEHDVLKRLSLDDFKAFHKAASEAASRAREALDSTDAQESAELWRSLLGNRFPLPGPRGGDRATSVFAAPTKPAQPQSTQRFA